MSVNLILSLLSPAGAVRLVTTTSLPDISPERAIRFLSIPSNWPSIVLSSWAVRGTDIDRPLAPGEVVDEIFGLPPLLPLEVSWTCTSIGESTAVFDSPSGLAGVAENCQMDFVAEKDGAGGSLLRLAMSYEPLSPLANAAVPLLTLDNAIALKLLLPARLRPPGSSDPAGGPLAALARRAGLLPDQDGKT